MTGKRGRRSGASYGGRRRGDYRVGRREEKRNKEMRRAGWGKEDRCGRGAGRFSVTRRAKRRWVGTGKAALGSVEQRVGESWEGTRERQTEF